jgi:ribosomal protein S18 acetylase RimI-like enzyme
MQIEFSPLNRKELRQAAELAARAFSDYEYFTNWFPDQEERARVERTIIWQSYKTNFKRVHQLSAKLDGKIVATAELNAPDYKDPSVLSYLLHGWLKVYKTADKKRIDDWIAMDEAAGQPCHEYQKTGPDIWYVSSLTVDPSMQGIGLGTKFVDYYENYILERGGKQVVLVTNSQKNLNFYLKCGYELFDEREFVYNGNRMGSWSLKKVL